MRYFLTDFYNQFKCVGASCPETCCQGYWDIIIDDKTYKMYEAYEEPFRSSVLSGIENNGDKYRIKFDEEKMCPFLRNGLCGLYIEKGEKAMSFTCATHPRSVMMSNSLTCMSVMASCPEVAKILWHKRDRIDFTVYEDENCDNSPNSEENDVKFSLVLEGLIASVAILQDDVPMNIKLRLLVNLNMLIERALIDHNESAVTNVAVQLQNPDVRYSEYSGYADNTDSNSGKGIEILNYTLSLFEYVERNEKMKTNILLGELEKLIKAQNSSDGEARKSFMKNRKILLENLMVNFLFEKYLGIMQGDNPSIHIFKVILYGVFISLSPLSSENLDKSEMILLISRTSKLFENATVFTTISERIYKEFGIGASYMLIDLFE